MRFETPDPNPDIYGSRSRRGRGELGLIGLLIVLVGVFATNGDGEATGDVCEAMRRETYEMLADRIIHSGSEVNGGERSSVQFQTSVLECALARDCSPYAATATGRR